MIVLGADAHKRSHTIAAVETATGQVLGDKTAAAAARGFGQLLIWARGLDRQRVWAQRRSSWEFHVSRRARRPWWIRWLRIGRLPGE
jgi:hypothetical protein